MESEIGFHFLKEAGRTVAQLTGVKHATYKSLDQIIEKFKTKAGVKSLLLTVNLPENEVMKEHLKELGFRLLVKFYNPNTDGNVYLWERRL